MPVSSPSPRSLVLSRSPRPQFPHRTSSSVVRAAWCACVFMTLLWGSVQSAQAQVNTEAILSDGRSDPWSTYGDLSFALRRGNVTTSRATLGLGGRYLTLHNDRKLPRGGEPWFQHRLMFSGSWSIENSAGARSDHVAFAHLRYTQMVAPRYGYELFSQANFDQFQRLNLRLLLGGGYRMVVANDHRIQFWFGTGLFAEQEDYNLKGVEGADQYPEDRLNVRWSTYGTLKVNAPDQRISLVNTLYVQPTIDNFRDLRIYYEGRFTARVYRMLAISLSSTITHDTTPVPGIQKTDIRFNGALQFRLYGTRQVPTTEDLAPTRDELWAYGLSKARPFATYRVHQALLGARLAVRDELAAREQREALARALASQRLEEARAHAHMIAHASPPSIRDLDAWREPSAHAAMNAAFVASRVLLQAVRIEPKPLPKPPPAPVEETPPVVTPPIEGPDDVLFDPVVQ